MNFKLSKKIIILIIFLLLLLIGGVFYYKSKQIKGSPDDYIIVETEDGIIVKNEKAGFIMRAPDGWTARKIDVMEGSVVFYSPDAQGLNPDKIKPPLQKGCMIEAAMAYKSIDFDKLKEEIKEIHSGLTIRNDIIETIELYGKNFLKNSFDCLELDNSVSLYYVLKNKFYSFSVSSSHEDIEKCSEFLNNFIKETSIAE